MKAGTGIVFSEKLLEISQGEWAGRRRSEIYTPEQRRIITQDAWNFKAPGGESQREVELRGLSLLEEMDYRHTDGTAAVFGHGMLFKCMLRGILGSDPRMTWRIGIDNTSMTKLSHDDLGWRVDYINATPHLR